MKYNLSSLLLDTDKIWLIDLDNTLFDAINLMAKMDIKIAQYLMYKCRCNYQEAIKIRKYLFAKHKNTFMGTVKERIIKRDELDEFLRYAHNFNIPKTIKTNESMKKILYKIKGKKYVFSNGTRSHVYKVIQRLEISNIFDGYLSLEDFNYSFKPNHQPFRIIKQKFNIDYHNFVFVDDSKDNIMAARELGIIAINSKHIFI